MASEKLRTVQGNWTDTFSRRGAAVFAPVRRMWMRFRAAGSPVDSSSSSGLRRLTLAAFLRFSCRCSRPPSVVTAPSSSFSTTAGRPPRRGRSRPAASGTPMGGPFSAGDSLRGEVLAASAASRFCSCLRRCSERGLVPAWLARIASRGSRMSGFCGAGSAFFDRGICFDVGGKGANLIAGALSLSSFSLSLSFSLTFSAGTVGPAAGLCLSRSGFSAGLEGRTGTLPISAGLEGKTGTLPPAVPAGAM